MLFKVSRTINFRPRHRKVDFVEFGSASNDTVFRTCQPKTIQSFMKIEQKTKHILRAKIRQNHYIF